MIATRARSMEWLAGRTQHFVEQNKAFSFQGYCDEFEKLYIFESFSDKLKR